MGAVDVRQRALPQAISGNHASDFYGFLALS